MIEGGDQRLQASERAAVGAVAATRSVHFAFDEPRVLEDLQVLRDGGRGEWNFIGKLTGDADVLCEKRIQDSNARWVSDCFAELGELLFRLVTGRWRFRDSVGRATILGRTRLDTLSHFV